MQVCGNRSVEPVGFNSQPPFMYIGRLEVSQPWQRNEIEAPHCCRIVECFIIAFESSVTTPGLFTTGVRLPCIFVATYFYCMAHLAICR